MRETVMPIAATSRTASFTPNFSSKDFLNFLSPLSLSTAATSVTAKSVNGMAMSNCIGCKI
ncbi:MAG: hypothetical protein ACPLW5_00245 [Candidatus Bathyarchaeales archaeon]